jgi:acyl-CoA thioester hydrolase
VYSFILTPRYSDLDTYNHVNNAVYLSYLEEARIAFTKAIGLREMFSRQCSTILAHASIDYRSPAFLGDELRIEIGAGEVRRSAFEFQYRILRPKDDKLIAEAKTVQVCFNFDVNAVTRVPEHWREVLQQHSFIDV